MRPIMPRFRLSRRAVILFWVIVIVTLLALFFWAPVAFFRITQTPYQETPFVNTPSP